MSIKWRLQPERVQFVHQLWLTEMSSREIGLECSAKWGETVSKNAIVSIVHREEWEGRPSPIVRTDPALQCEKRKPSGEPRKTCQPVRGPSLPPLTSLAAPPIIAPTPVVVAPPVEAKHYPTRLVREPGKPIYRRDGSGCYAVKGEGKAMKMCDGPLSSILNSYCDDCAEGLYLSTRKKKKINKTDETKFTPKINNEGADDDVWDYCTN